MWLQKKKSTARESNFSCSSFKDIHRLFPSDSNPQPLHNNNTSNNSSKASIFHRVRLAQSILRAWAPRPSLPPPDSNNGKASPSESLISLPGSEKRIVVYYTSLRVVRTTFDDCKDVLSILRGFRVSIDERDLAMDSKFMDELQGILRRRSISLPRIFIEGRYIGGADEIRHLHEAGELKKCLQAIPPAVGGVCENCGGFRFILCDECSGSRKIFSDKSGFRSCTACNENGLMRCTHCC